MTGTLSLGQYLVRVVIPVAGVVGSVALLAIAVVVMLLDVQGPSVRQGLFAAGVLSWIFGVGWGVIVNARPPVPRAPPHD